MAGAGYRQWVAGELITDAHMQNYLQDQVIMTFASAAARDTAITSPQPGMFVYLTDTNLLYRWVGSPTNAWTEYASGSGGGASLADIFLLAGM